MPFLIPCNTLLFIRQPAGGGIVQSLWVQPLPEIWHHLKGSGMHLAVAAEKLEVFSAEHVLVDPKLATGACAKPAQDRTWPRLQQSGEAMASQGKHSQDAS